MKYKLNNQIFLFAWFSNIIYICSVMKKKNIITIDLDQWQTQKEAAINWNGAGKKGCSPEYISKLIREGKTETFEIEELGLKLVPKSLTSKK